MVLARWSVHSARLSAESRSWSSLTKCDRAANSARTRSSSGVIADPENTCMVSLVMPDLRSRVRRGLPAAAPGQTAPDTPTARDETYPFDALPVIEGVCSDTPSLKTMSELRETRDRFVTLCW